MNEGKIARKETRGTRTAYTRAIDAAIFYFFLLFRFFSLLGGVMK